MVQWTMSTEQTLQKWIPDAKKTTLAVYDFDNTLFDSPSREAGEAKYLLETGKIWIEHGGIFIYHQNTKQTIQELNKYYSQ